MTHEESNAPAHPSTERDPEETPHACLNGFVFVGYIDEHGEEREATYPCRRCNDAVGDVR